jgi:hypothetical protein
MAEKILTAQQAENVSKESFNDFDTVLMVQKTLKDKGYVDVGEFDGDLGKMTIDAIMSFRTRNNLPLVPVIDNQFLDALERAPQKEIPPRQASASVEHVAERVEAVKKTDQIERVSWWSKFVAWIIGAPSVALAILQAIISNIDDAISAVTPIKDAFGTDIPITWMIFIFIAIAIILGYQQYRIGKLSAQVKEELVDGYRVGTVKNDAKPPLSDAVPVLEQKPGAPIGTDA